ncbi:transcriptional regulator [Bordetella pertussis]|nr:transcriptional regulator [Bordetella pertussis]
MLSEINYKNDAIPMQPFSTRPPDPDGLPASQPARRKRAASAAGAASPDFITALARGLDVLRCFRPGVRPWAIWTWRA